MARRRGHAVTPVSPICESLCIALHFSRQGPTDPQNRRQSQRLGGVRWGRMRALRFYAPEDLRLEDVPEPECGPGEIKLKVHNCSTCGTDVKILHNGHQNLTPPRTTGHEIAGEVVEVGADVNGTYGSSWETGDRVQV